MAAGPEVITRTRLYLNQTESFAIETTASTLATIREARQRGFTVRLFYVCLRNAEENIKRVRERVARGGHFVPDEDIRRRYERRLQTYAPALCAEDEAFIFDNSGGRPCLVLVARLGVVLWRGERARLGHVHPRTVGDRELIRQEPCNPFKWIRYFRTGLRLCHPT